MNVRTSRWIIASLTIIAMACIGAVVTSKMPGEAIGGLIGAVSAVVGALANALTHGSRPGASDDGPEGHKPANGHTDGKNELSSNP